jgi:outer membrane protein assembly factor BamB
MTIPHGGDDVEFGGGVESARHGGPDVRALGSLGQAFHEGTHGVVTFGKDKTFGAVGFDARTFVKRWKILLSPDTVAATGVDVGKSCFYVRRVEWTSKAFLSCLDLESGATRWSRELGDAFVLDAHGDRLYLGSDRGKTLEVLDEMGAVIGSLSAHLPPVAEAR